MSQHCNDNVDCVLSGVSLNTSMGANFSMSRLNEEMSKVEETGEGSFGLVKKGVLDLDQCSYAIKQTKKSISGEGDLQQRLQEMYVISSFEHANILRYYDAWVEEKAVFLRTEWVPHGSVARFPRPIPEKSLLSLIHQISSALHRLHSRGFVHRDIKPENILAFSKDDGTYLFKLCDFGLSRPTAHTASATGEQFKGLNDDDGDRNYIAPEIFSVCDAANAGFETDVYALGATCVELMGGDPFAVRDEMYTGSFSCYSGALQSLVKRISSTSAANRPSAFSIAIQTLGSDVCNSSHLLSEKALLIEKLKEKVSRLHALNRA